MNVLSDDELRSLGDRIADTAALIDATTHRLLTDLRRFDNEEGWARQGLLSCAHWLNWRCGITLSAAREKVRVAHAIAGLPLIDEALRRGEVSYSKVRAMTRVADRDREADLLELARRTTASGLEGFCRALRQVQPRAPGRDAELRWLRVHDGEDGMVRIEVQVRPEEASRILAALDTSAEARVDGLVAMAEAALRGDHPERPPVEVLVQIDAATVQGRAGDSGISAAVAEKLLCDCAAVPVVTDEQGSVLDVGRKTRIVPTALRRALLVRDGGCRFPGCTNHRFVDAHHVVHWVQGGATSLGNMILLCAAHHTLVHEGGFQIRSNGGILRFTSPAGTETAPPTVRISPHAANHQNREALFSAAPR